MSQKNYRKMTDSAIKIAVRAIVRDSSSDEEIERRIASELDYPYRVGIDSLTPTDEIGRQAQVIVEALGGLTRKDGAMVMLMIHGPGGNVIMI